MQVKLFTHTDLDGISCAVAAMSVFGTAYVNTTYCNYDTLKDELATFFRQQGVIGFDYFDYVFITDLNMKKAEMDIISPYLESGKVFVFDHHKTELTISDPNVIIQTHKENGNPTCGTELFVEYLIEHLVPTSSQFSFASNLTVYAELVRLYDTYEFKNNKNFEAYSETVENLNALCHIYTRDEFIDKMTGRIIFNKPFIMAEDQAIITILNRMEKDYVESIIDTALIDDNCCIVFADKYISSIGYKLTTTHPDKVACIIDIAHGRISLRSSNASDIDVSAIAKKNGGGGHKNAAGYTIDIVEAILIKNKAAQYVLCNVINDYFREKEIHA